jgi:hypothetical protein
MPFLAVAELYVVGHPSCSFSCLDLRTDVAQQVDGTIERPRFDEREFERCVELVEERGSASTKTSLRPPDHVASLLSTLVQPYPSPRLQCYRLDRGVGVLEPEPQRGVGRITEVNINLTL